MVAVAVVDDDEDRAAPFVVDDIVATRWMLLSLGKLSSLKIV